MRFELFDRDADAPPPPPAEPRVQVSSRGWLLFNSHAGAFLSPFGVRRQVVSLLFDPEVRQVSIRPEQLAAKAELPSTMWEVQRMRNQEWHLGVAARPFVAHYRIAAGTYTARLLRGPGPRMVLFDAGPERDLPAGDPPGVVRADEPLAEAEPAR